MFRLKVMYFKIGVLMYRFLGYCIFNCNFVRFGRYIFIFFVGVESFR